MRENEYPILKTCFVNVLEELKTVDNATFVFRLINHNYDLDINQFKDLVQTYNSYVDNYQTK